MLLELALSGILSALAVVFLLLTGVLPTLKLTMLVLSSICMGVIIVECKMKYAWLSYVVVSVISFLIVPYKSLALLFLVYFGLYPILKFILEDKVGKALAYVLKFIWFNISAVLVGFVTVKFFSAFASEIVDLAGNLLDKINSIIGDNMTLLVVILAVILNVVFFAFDYLFSCVMIYYEDKVRSKLKR